MATTLDGRTRLHWESTGDGAPVLLIMGLGLSGGAWWRTVPVLSRRLRVITFDNRGVGRSRAFSHAYTTEAMADDAASVLDDAGPRARARLRDLARRHGRAAAGAAPSGARALARARCDEARRSARARADGEVIAFFRRRLRMAPEEAARASVPFNYGPRCRAEHAERIEEDIAQRLAHPFSEQAYRAQLFAAACHNCYGAPVADRRPDPRRARRARPRHPRRQRAPDRRAHPGRAAARPRGLRPPVPDRGAGGRRGDRRVPRRAPRGGAHDVRPAARRRPARRRRRPPLRRAARRRRRPPPRRRGR